MRPNIDFAFILHPLKKEDVFRKLKFMKRWPDSLVNHTMRLLPPLFTSYITGIHTPYSSTKGCFIGVPLLPEQILGHPRMSLRKIIAAGKKAEKIGARIVGLGAMTAVVGDAGITIDRNLGIAVTTGNSYTVATALQATRRAVSLMGKDMSKAEVAVLGATGSIGSVCARILAREAGNLTLIARSISRLKNLAKEIRNETGVAVSVTSDVKNAVKHADVVVAVSGATEALVEPEDLKAGAVVCDVARPRDVSTKVAERDDVLIIEGGVIEIPGEVEFNFDFGFPPKTAYACMAETMILALEKRYESYSLGRDLHVSKVDEIRALADKHGFKLAGLRSFERELEVSEIKRIKERAKA